MAGKNKSSAKSKEPQDLFQTPDFAQGHYGDCQTIVVQYGISKTPEGNKYLNGLIDQSKAPKQYTVNFPGREPVVITDKDLAADSRLMKSQSKGQILLDYAALKVASREDKVPNPFKLYMGADKETYLLNLKDAGQNVLNVAKNPAAAALIEQVKENKGVIIGHLSAVKGEVSTNVTDIDGKTAQFMTDHAYIISVRKDGNIEVRNPHDTKNTTVLSPEEATKVFTSVEISAGPGKQIVFPPQYEKLRKLSSDASNKYNEVRETAGAYNLNDLYRRPMSMPLLEREAQARDALSQGFKEEAGTAESKPALESIPDAPRPTKPTPPVQPKKTFWEKLFGENADKPKEGGAIASAAVSNTKDNKELANSRESEAKGPVEGKPLDNARELLAKINTSKENLSKELGSPGYDTTHKQAGLASAAPARGADGPAV